MRKPYGVLEQINSGCLQRIADAVEKMAENHLVLIAERDKYKRWYEGLIKEDNVLRKRCAAYKGLVKTLKQPIIIKKIKGNK